MNAAIPIGVVVWLVLVLSGFLDLTRYGSTPGAEGQPPGTWPRDVSLCLDQRVPTLLVFAHPRCPCTAATLAELDRVMTRCASRLATTVVFYADPEQGPEPR